MIQQREANGAANPNRRQKDGAAIVLFEAVESRVLFSSSAGAGVVVPNLVINPSATAADSGFSVEQIRKAYGFDKISFAGGAIAADGTGQTIAIVDAYNDPNIVADLKVFNQAFGLPDAQLSVVNQNGGSHLPATDAGWAGEIALDVEWAHAIAPGAKILLVEANSATTADLMQAVDHARHAAGVSTVSMSWGGSEFINFGGAESESQLTYDPTFTTPNGHQGVTFIAAAGDSGQGSGVQWPSSSPNVMAVGGTNLFLNSDGSYNSEGPWRGFRSGTSGGFSEVEAEPDYQTVAQQTGARSTPDVGYNADPNTGFPVYDSLSYQGISGWQEIGGTSAGSPQWAALVAIANQGRALAGLGSLDGPTQTLPALYSMYSAPGTDAYTTTYLNAFNDIGNDGYGYTTGLGSPHADVVVNKLLGPAGNDGTTPTDPSNLPASPVAIDFSTVPISGFEGDAGTLKVKLSNLGSTTFDGPVTVTLYTSTDGTVDAGDQAIGSVTIPELKLHAGQSKKVKIHYTLPTGLTDADYQMLAQAVATATQTAPAVVAATVTLQTPRVDLSAVFATAQPIQIEAGSSNTVKVTISNLGNVTAKGTATLNLYASADGAVDGADAVLKTIDLKSLKIKAGHSKTLRIHVKPTTQQMTLAQNLLATLVSTTNPADDTASDDLAVATLS